MPSEIRHEVPLVAIDPEDRQICTSADDADSAGPHPVAQSIAQTSLFTFDTFEALSAGLDDEYRNSVYTRGRNPTVQVLEEKLAKLERGEACKVFASGMAAVSSVILGLAEKGDHIVFVNQIYGPTLELADQLTRFGISYDQVRSGHLADIERSVKPETRLIWLESPGTMLFELLDITAITDLARTRGITTVMDNSWATPVFQKPLTMGVDIVVHSCTKYLGGHSDLVAGAVIAPDDILEQIFYRAFLLNGAAVGPFDAWLATRGLRTLPIRMEQHELGALRVAAYLQDHERVARVFHPALTGDQSLLNKQMTGTAGLFSFELRDAEFDDIRNLLNTLNVFRLGVSWGGFESLAISPNRGTNADRLQAVGIPAGLIRLSVGQEDADVLIADLEQALTV
jgi:cystathionine beta-lyase/cystathionine gamma-synthase